MIDRIRSEMKEEKSTEEWGYGYVLYTLFLLDKSSRIFAPFLSLAGHSGGTPKTTLASESSN